MQYDVNKKRVKQKLESLSLYDLEGEFDEVVKHLGDKLAADKDYYSTPRKISESSYKGMYADGTSAKLVAFDKFFVEVGYYEADSKELQIWGERDILPEEMKALEAKAIADKKQSDEYKRKQYEALKKELGE